MKGSPGLVLLIEEDHALARRISEGLEAKGFSVRCTIQHEAVRAAEAWRPALIVLDCGLDKDAAATTLARLRADARTAAFPVAVLACGPADHEDPIEGVLREIADDYWRMHDTSQVAISRIEAHLTGSTAAAGPAGAG